MRQVKVKKALKMDHTVKFCKRLNVCLDAKMLLLIQNEIGQIVGRRLTRSENHEETEKLLLEVEIQFAAIDDCFVVSEIATAVRKLIEKCTVDQCVSNRTRFMLLLASERN
ncbi:hypothetical protein JG688_00015999 [Phytophthora aleatoria]|uniref:Uncharacterized protein n=1 Tax=Phytophthora aleatoria TaxID=2496075 RepID=A0A8J5ID65_9STRA|nr:hypothetical protein JG688_00015999 [Phytophthora aleatoria]